MVSVRCFGVRVSVMFHFMFVHCIIMKNDTYDVYTTRPLIRMLYTVFICFTSRILMSVFSALSLNCASPYRGFSYMYLR